MAKHPLDILNASKAQKLVYDKLKTFDGEALCAIEYRLDGKCSLDPGYINGSIRAHSETCSYLAMNYDSVEIFWKNIEDM